MRKIIEHNSYGVTLPSEYNKSANEMINRLKKKRYTPLASKTYKNKSSAFPGNINATYSRTVPSSTKIYTESMILNGTARQPFVDGPVGVVGRPMTFQTQVDELNKENGDFAVTFAAKPRFITISQLREKINSAKSVADVDDLNRLKSIEDKLLQLSIAGDLSFQQKDALNELSLVVDNIIKNGTVDVDSGIPIAGPVAIIPQDKGKIDRLEPVLEENMEKMRDAQAYLEGEAPRIEKLTEMRNKIAPDGINELKLERKQLISQRKSLRPEEGYLRRVLTRKIDASGNKIARLEPIIDEINNFEDIVKTYYKLADNTEKLEQNIAIEKGLPSSYIPPSISVRKGKPLNDTDSLLRDIRELLKTGVILGGSPSTRPKSGRRASVSSYKPRTFADISGDEDEEKFDGDADEAEALEDLEAAGFSAFDPSTVRPLPEEITLVGDAAGVGGAVDYVEELEDDGGGAADEVGGPDAGYGPSPLPYDKGSEFPDNRMKIFINSVKSGKITAIPPKKDEAQPFINKILGDQFYQGVTIDYLKGYVNSLTSNPANQYSAGSNPSKPQLFGRILELIK